MEDAKPADRLLGERRKLIPILAGVAAAIAVGGVAASVAFSSEQQLSLFEHVVETCSVPGEEQYLVIEPNPDEPGRDMLVVHMYGKQAHGATGPTIDCVLREAAIPQRVLVSAGDTRDVLDEWFAESWGDYTMHWVNRPYTGSTIVITEHAAP